MDEQRIGENSNMADMQVSVTMPTPETITLVLLGDTLCKVFAEPDLAKTLHALRAAVAQVEGLIAQQPPAAPQDAPSVPPRESEVAPAHEPLAAETDGSA
jgi:hypothetical protein